MTEPTPEQRAEQLLADLDLYARTYNCYEYGLPMHIEELVNLRAIVLAAEAPLRQEVERLRAAQQWTKSPPTVVGEYWWRDTDYRPRVVFVFEWRENGLGVYLPSRSGHERGIVPVIEVAGEWAGPLTSPT